MKNKIIIGAMSFAICAPAMADIGQNATSATCDSATIGATSGDANLQAAWQANTINLDWYNGDTKQTSTTCQYDGAITLPSNPSPKTGYTFGGWKVRVSSNNNNNQTPITLSSLYSSESINVFSSKSLNPGVYCEGSSGWDPDAEDGEGGYIWYGTEEQGEGACSDSRFSGLNNGEWRVTMPNGSVVKGEARCSTVGSGYDYAQTGTPTDDLDLNDLSNGAQYCWCQATGADTTGNGTYQSVAGSRWVFSRGAGRGGASRCALSCANICADGVNANDDFRRAVFGISE